MLGKERGKLRLLGRFQQSGVMVIHEGEAIKNQPLDLQADRGQPAALAWQWVFTPHSAFCILHFNHVESPISLSANGFSSFMCSPSAARSRWLMRTGSPASAARKAELSAM